MTYRYATVRENHEDLASGAVLRSAPGFPAFPVRLAVEIFQRALALRGGGRVTLWDPCCGSGYLLTVIAMLHRPQVAAVLASDISAEALELAERNLALLSHAGLVARAEELDELAARFGKPSYATAAQAARRLARAHPATDDLACAVRRADVFDPEALRSAMRAHEPDLVITDVPYGEQTAWSGPASASGISGMVRSLGSLLPAQAVIAVTARGRKVPLDQDLRPNATFKIGTRAVALFRT